MKKSILFLCIAALGLSACFKVETVTTEQPQEIGFKAVSSNVTKADSQLEGTLLNKDYSIYASATQKNPEGTIENPAFFTDQQFQTEDATVSASSKYRAWDGAKAKPIYWPIGGGIIDFLAYALPTASHGTPAATYAKETTDVASIVTFEDWDTYTNQVDLLYAVNNGKTSATDVKLSFNHAQALLVFQVKVNTADIITINSVQIDGLLTKGTFTVDNSRNNLAASWSELVNEGNEAIPAGAVTDKDNLGEAVTSTAEFSQIGSSLLVPEQPRLNFTISYLMGGKTMKYTYNEARGTWEMGKKYIYKLDMTLNEIILTEEVVDFVDASIPEIDL